MNSLLFFNLSMFGIDTVPEWLRGLPRKQLGSPARVRIASVSFFLFPQRSNYLGSVRKARLENIIPSLFLCCTERSGKEKTLKPGRDKYLLYL